MGIVSWHVMSTMKLIFAVDIFSRQLHCPCCFLESRPQCAATTKRQGRFFVVFLKKVGVSQFKSWNYAVLHELIHKKQQCWDILGRSREKDPRSAALKQVQVPTSRLDVQVTTGKLATRVGGQIDLPVIIMGMNLCCRSCGRWRSLFVSCCVH